MYNVNKKHCSQQKSNVLLEKRKLMEKRRWSPMLTSSELTTKVENERKKVDDKKIYMRSQNHISKLSNKKKIQILQNSDAEEDTNLSESKTHRSEIRDPKKLHKVVRLKNQKRSMKQLRERNIQNKQTNDIEPSAYSDAHVANEEVDTGIYTDNWEYNNNQIYEDLLHKDVGKLEEMNVTNSNNDESFSSNIIEIYEEDDDNNQLFGPTWPYDKMALLINNVYCKKHVLQSSLRASRKTSHLVRRLLEGVFKPEAIQNCTFSGQVARAQGKERQKEVVYCLNISATNAIIDYSIYVSNRKGWEVQDKCYLKRAMSQRVGELKRKFKNAQISQI